MRKTEVKETVSSPTRAAFMPLLVCVSGTAGDKKPVEKG